MPNNFTIMLLMIMLVLTSACQTTKQLSLRDQECHFLTSELSKDSEWVNTCLTHDQTYSIAAEEYLKAMPPKELCLTIDHAANSSVSNRVREARGVNCEPYKKENAEQFAQSISMHALCHAWQNGTGDKIKDQAIRAEVKDREVDCPAVLMSLAQREAAVAQQRSAAIQEQQRRDQILRDALDTLKPSQPVHTNCIKTFTGFNCTSF